MVQIPPETSLISYDPGEWAGFAFWRQAILISCGKGEATGADYCACELPRIYPMGKSRARPNDLIKLAATAGRLTAPWPEDKLIWVPPHDWKGQVPQDILEERIWEALSLVERQRLNEVVSLYAKGKRHNILDAVGIGLYVLKRRRTGMI